MKMRFYLVPTLGLVGFGVGFSMTPVWSGSVDTGNWERSVDIAPEAFADAAEGTVLKIDFGVTESSGKMELNTSAFDLLDAQRTLTNLNALGEFPVGVTSTEATLSGRDARLLRQKGMKIIGEWLNITAVGLQNDSPFPPDNPIEEPDYPEALYITTVSSPSPQSALTRVGHRYFSDAVQFESDSRFVLATVDADSWESVTSRRCFGAVAAGEDMRDGVAVSVKVVDAGNEPESWTIERGMWTFVADLDAMTLTPYLSPSALNQIDAGAETAEEAYFTLTGMRVTYPCRPGIYIARRADGTFAKVQLR